MFATPIKDVKSILSDDEPFCDFEELQDLDINHWSARDLSFDDVHEYLEDRSDQIKKTRAYKKLFPSKVSLDNGFLYDFDAYLLKSSCFDIIMQLIKFQYIITRKILHMTKL